MTRILLLFGSYALCDPVRISSFAFILCVSCQFVSLWGSADTLSLSHRWNPWLLCALWGSVRVTQSRLCSTSSTASATESIAGLEMAAAFSPQRNWFCPWLPHSKSKVWVKLFGLAEGVFLWFLFLFFWFFFKLASLLSAYEIHLLAEKK